MKGFHHAFATPEDEAAAELAAETATLSLKAQGMKEWLAKSKKAEVSKEEAEARVKQLSDQLEKTQKKANGAESKELKDAVNEVMERTNISVMKNRLIKNLSKGTARE